MTLYNIIYHSLSLSLSLSLSIYIYIYIYIMPTGEALPRRGRSSSGSPSFDRWRPTFSQRKGRCS